MVVYDLVCKKNHRFEGWFPSFETYREQAENGQISCPRCGSSEVEKLPHACAVLSRREREQEKRAGPDPPSTPDDAGMREMLIRLHHYVRENFEDVGPRFAEEARAVFYGKSDNRPIHGTSTEEERQALDEEGIPYVALPKPELDS